jgi:hypothetical protein
MTFCHHFPVTFFFSSSISLLHLFLLDLLLTSSFVLLLSSYFFISSCPVSFFSYSFLPIFSSPIFPHLSSSLLLFVQSPDAVLVLQGLEGLSNEVRSELQGFPL